MTREMTRKQFHAALARRGWRQHLLWVDLNNGVHLGLRLYANGRRKGKVAYRSTLAACIAEAEAVERKKQVEAIQ